MPGNEIGIDGDMNSVEMGWRKKKAAHSDDVQNTEQAVDAIPCEHVLHHGFSAILKTERAEKHLNRYKKLWRDSTFILLVQHFNSRLHLDI